MGGGKFRLFISNIYLEYRKETTELINIWIPIIDKKNFNFNFEEKKLQKTASKEFTTFLARLYFFLSDFDLPRLILFVLKFHGNLPLEKLHKK